MTEHAGSADRHAWLEIAVAWAGRALDRAGYPVPGNVRVSIGFTGSRMGQKAIGACWYPEAVSDGSHEIFIGPHVTDPVEIVGVIVHELIHAAVGKEAGHRGAFKKAATAIGLEGKMTATTVGEGLRAAIEQKLLKSNPYKWASIDVHSRKKQSTRLLKAACPHCGYTVRVTAKWLAVGTPFCPVPHDEDQPTAMES